MANTKSLPAYLKDSIVRDVKTVKEFLARYYKPDRYTGRGKEYAAHLLLSHEEDFEKDGYDCISKHDSVTGRFVTLAK